MKLKFESGKFATPSLEDVKKALLTGLKENYEQVNIEVVDCPNLKDWGCPCLLYTSPSPRDKHRSRMPSSA